MKLFISDLDNTLIYSYKREIGREKQLVETMDEKELSYMTAAAYRLLFFVKEQYCFIPATTRSLEQYGRISFFPQWTPELALASNGGNLLRRGRPDEAWYEESKALCAEAEGALKAAERLLTGDTEISAEIRLVDGLFLFTKSEEPEATTAALKSELAREPVQILCNGTKVYVVPNRLSKGEAVRRLRARLKAEGGGLAELSVVSAGDSEFDISMLLEAEEAWFPEELNRDRLYEHPGKRVVPGGRLFSDCLLSALAEVARRST